MNKVLLALVLLLSGAFFMGAGTVINTPGVPAGAIMPFGMATCPQGWLAADGTNKLKATYPALNTALGTTWGAGDSSNFTLPDFRGVFVKGAGTTTRAAGKAADGTTYYAGGMVGTYTQDKFQTHKHQMLLVTGGTLAGAGTGAYKMSNQASIFSANYTGTTAQTDGNSISDAPIAYGAYGAPRSDVTTEPQSAAVTYCIKF